MRTQRSWPHRFKVVVRTAPDTAVPYSVVTWLAEEKAIALAVTIFGDTTNRTGFTTLRWRISDQ